ncbi:MAG: alanine transaminase [Nitrospirae bacterium RIFCSPLOW2_12_42_9]|nr:MAG: alanine transaminase [Nitrospirae bacterium RIFCSPLOWO2_02_42_7]OGW57439.1 MAG: alanine transaminase [Nitrospirae bacterium RIFCSPLOW2_12_42_9]HAS18072.1 alanine transaminase [Nitrospiraceae bacterium]
MREFNRIKRLPPYVFSIVTSMKIDARRRGEDIIDLGMGNPDMASPPHVVEKLIESARNPKNHRYSASKGITKLRTAIVDWYKRRYNVDIDSETEAVVTIGAKEGLSHLALAIINPGDIVLAPNPTYPIHSYSVIIVGGEIKSIPLREDNDFFEDICNTYKEMSQKPKMLIISFPHNPTTSVVDIGFFKRIVDFAHDNDLMVIHDISYADLVFDGYVAPSFLQVPGAKDVGVEFFSVSKSYNMPGWRVGFCVGNKEMVGALIKIKSYLDYGVFQPIQIASILALNGPQECVQETVNIYKSRRDALVDGLNRIGWSIKKPLGTMFVWARIPEEFKRLGSLEFSKLLLTEGKVAVSPGIGFGEFGDDYVRFALVENEKRIRQAVQGIKKVLSK